MLAQEILHHLDMKKAPPLLFSIVNIITNKRLIQSFYKQKLPVKSIFNG
ncbi:hypothetical protein HMPREF9707_00222 [Falseniella ignava CCUG 37419]|uniref:Uncharacterized protein n=1 Tax=Falseniella ignava CCUG 37419 TaxID=883112 RepID=K1M2S2_9LACT|nr:hypothetical protein HMPREF9707_00222 [Falseniella ignava CCUG 37419]